MTLDTFFRFGCNGGIPNAVSLKISKALVPESITHFTPFVPSRMEQQVESTEQHVEPMEKQMEPQEHQVEPLEHQVEPMEQQVEPLEQQLEPVEQQVEQGLSVLWEVTSVHNSWQQAKHATTTLGYGRPLIALGPGLTWR